MVIAKADDKQRVRIPDIKPGQIFAILDNGDGSLTLTPVVVKKPQPKPGTVKFIEKDGFTVGITNRQPSLDTIKELLADFP